ncbi:MAG TPA: 3'-5' exonuclease [bacterium]|nr:3'-5' exonuclease [bacterium]
MYLFFDTETTGLPINWNAPISDFSNWPRVVQIAWAHYNEKGKEVKSKTYIIKPENFFIPIESARVHGITTEMANESGIELKAALNEFTRALKDSQYLIAHNISFDEKVVGAEFLRKNMKNNIQFIKKICTMESSVDFCKIPGKDKYKFPKLDELYFKLFNAHFSNAHNALVDVRACARCFFELQKLGVIKSPETKQEKKSLLQQSIFNF